MSDYSITTLIWFSALALLAGFACLLIMNRLLNLWRNSARAAGSTAPGTTAAAAATTAAAGYFRVRRVFRWIASILAILLVVGLVGWIYSSSKKTTPAAGTAPSARITVNPVNPAPAPPPAAATPAPDASVGFVDGVREWLWQQHQSFLQFIRDLGLMDWKVLGTILLIILAFWALYRGVLWVWSGGALRIGQAVLALLALGFLLSLPWADFGSGSRSTAPLTTAQVARAPICAQEPKTFDLAPGRRQVINTHSCQLRWKIRSGCVKALRSDGTVLRSQVCAGEERLVSNGLHEVVAIGYAKVRRIECPPRSTGDLLDSCV